MRVCLYTHTALPLIGGQEIVVDSLAREYQRQGHEVVVLAPRPSRPWRLGDEHRPYPVVRHVRFVSLRHMVEVYRWFLLRLHHRWRFDVLHAHGLYPAGYLAALCRDRLGCPLVLTSHGEDLPATSRRLDDPEMRRRHVLAVARADAVIAISRFTGEQMCSLCPEKAGAMAHLPSGVDLTELAACADRPGDLDPAIRPGRYLFFLGRLEPRKGVDGLLSALKQVAPTGGVELVIAGDGSVRPGLQAQAVALGLKDRVRFVGMVHGATRAYLLQQARCLVAPSVSWEGQGLVVLESFAAGRPVIVSDLPGFADLVQPGQNGWVFPAGDVQSLADRLRQALHPDAPLDSLRQAAAAVAAQHTWPAVARRHLHLYQQVLAGKEQARAQEGPKEYPLLPLRSAEALHVVGPPGSAPKIGWLSRVWQRLHQGETRVWQRPDWPLFAGADWPDRILDVKVTDRFHAKQGRSTGRWLLEAAGRQLSVYLKRHYQLPHWRGLLSVLGVGAGWSPGLHEWQSLQWARAQGLPVPAPVAVGEILTPWGRLQSVLAIEELVGMLPLHLAVPLACDHLSPGAFRLWKRSLIEEMVGLVRRLHGVRRFHRDLYLCHFYIREEDTQHVPSWPGRVHLIDLHRLCHRPFGWRLWQAKDLGQLLYSSDVRGVNAGDRLHFWRLYLGGKRHSLVTACLRQLILFKWRNYRRNSEKRRRAREQGRRAA